MSGRFLFVCGALLVFANVALGDGTYQRTRDGKTFVWNNYPKPGDEATWSGGRDREGYARGFGTLIWYTVEPESETSFAKPALYARYWGNMVRGKLNGPVNVHSKKKTRYAIFADGARTTRWAAGPAPSRAGAQQRAAIAKKSPSRTGGPSRTGRAVAEEETQRSTFDSQQQAEAPAEGPQSGGAVKAQSPSSKSAIAESSQLSTNASAARTNSEPSEGWPKIDIDDSLRLLVWPPRSLRMRRGSLAGANPEAAAPAANARLTKEEVVDLADAVARSRGYDLIEYQRPEPQYDPADQTWSLLYDQTPVDGTAEIGKHFSVAVGDKTKRTVLVAGK